MVAWLFLSDCPPPFQFFYDPTALSSLSFPLFILQETPIFLFSLWYRAFLHSVFQCSSPPQSFHFHPQDFSVAQPILQPFQKWELSESFCCYISTFMFVSQAPPFSPAIFPIAQPVFHPFLKHNIWKRQNKIPSESKAENTWVVTAKIKFLLES